MSPPDRESFVDVDGTFTDVVGRRPGRGLTTFELLRSASIRGDRDARLSARPVTWIPIVRTNARERLTEVIYTPVVRFVGAMLIITVYEKKR